MDLFKLVKNKRKVLLVILVVVLISVMLFIRRSVSPEPSTKPPVIKSEKIIKVVESAPSGNTKILNKLFSVSIKFSEGIGLDAKSVDVVVTPYIAINKYIVSSEPQTLWIEPAPAGKDPGWKDEITYTVLLRKGSSFSTGSVLGEDYSFSFTNSTQGISMYAE